MSSSSSSSRFTLLSTDHLAQEPPSSTLTLRNLIDTSEAMADEAREVLPYSFDESVQLQLPNEKNVYNQNFGGKFCRCGRDYDPETEEEAMLNCMACEDWFHESCLNLRPRALPQTELTSSEPNTHSAGAVEEEEAEEAAVLIPSDSYDGLICSSCVASNTFLKSKAGSVGYMLIEPAPSSSFRVVGKAGQAEAGVERENGMKRSLDEGEEGVAKRAKLDPDTKVVVSDGGGRQGNGDIFLAHGIRDQLKAQLDSTTIASLPFPLVDEEIYEPPTDDVPEETMDQVTSRLMGALPRVQAIEALHGYEKMKGKLLEMLSGHAESGQTVSREDIESLFADLRRKG
ncbi:E3 ubiquitin-protein ligase UBR7, partial [Tremellales sp. Uapishka_1]